jgi:hypothetical protein
MLDRPLSERLRAVRESQAVEDAQVVSPTPSEPPRRVLLGELLVERGALSEADLMLALAQQRDDGRPLGQILLELGAVTPGDLARTLTEQHGFDFNASLRRRLQPSPAGAGVPGETGSSPLRDERYVVRESADGEPLHVADSFLDAADAAFELIEDRDPDQLEIVRSWNGEVEQLWSYRRAEAPDAATSASDAA